ILGGRNTPPVASWVSGVGFVSRSISQRRLKRSFFGSTDVEAERTLLALNAVDGCTSDQVAVELDCARCVIVARDRVVNNVRVAVRVTDSNNRNTQAASFLNGDRFLVGVNDEHQVRGRTHVA